nr:ribonuclease H-like domain-containing protein [Tanacetum cinerariifolium]
PPTPKTATHKHLTRGSNQSSDPRPSSGPPHGFSPFTSTHSTHHLTPPTTQTQPTFNSTPTTQKHAQSTASIPTETQTHITSQAINSNPPTRTHPTVTRNQDGTRKTTQRLNLHVSHTSPTPKSLSLALSDSHWRDAMHDEYNALIKNDTWVLIPKPPSSNIVRCLWLFRHKFHADRSLSRYKARLYQVGMDCDETFSPIVKLATIRIVLSLALTRHWPIHQLDVKNAFLNGDLSKTVYMQQPLGFVDPRYPYHVCRLQRSLYGLKQASRAWFHRFAAYSTRVGFSHSRYLGALNNFLGVFVTRDTIWMFLSQKRYAIELLEWAHMLNCNPTRTPIDIESNLGPEGTPISYPTLYRILAGGIHYLTFTRPNLSYVVQQICLYMHDPRELHLATLKRIIHADWAGCPATRRSTSKYCVFLGNNVLSWSSKRQPILSRSSVEADYRGVANVVAHTAWLRNLLRELHTPLLTATLVYCDNVSAVYLSANPVQHQQTKHIEIEIHFVLDMVAMGHV